MHPSAYLLLHIHFVMISLNRLIAFAQKWQRMAGVGQRSIGCGTKKVAPKGHFVVYTLDKRRFVFPLAYLQTDTFRELLRLSEEVFGLPSDGPITLPCDSVFLEYCVVRMLDRRASEEVQKELLLPLAFQSARQAIKDPLQACKV